MTRKGRVRISLDFEAGWGVAQGGGWRGVEAAGVYRELRPALRRFTARLDELELSFLWAVVGGMIDDPSQRDLSHLRGQFARDMQVFLAESKPETQDGRDLLDMVIGTKTRQNFGTHTYSHLLFSDVEQTTETVAADLVLAVGVNQRLGLGSSRLVFPRNHAGHFDCLYGAGITHVRMPPSNGFVPTIRPGRLRRGVSSIFRPPSPVSEKVGPGGLVFHYGTEFLNWGDGAGWLKRTIHWRRVNAALAAAEGGADVHFWLHPFNLAQSRQLADKVDAFLVKIAGLRDRGLIDIGGF